MPKPRRWPNSWTATDKKSVLEEVKPAVVGENKFVPALSKVTLPPRGQNRSGSCQRAAWPRPPIRSSHCGYPLRASHLRRPLQHCHRVKSWAPAYTTSVSAGITGFVKTRSSPVLGSVNDAVQVFVPVGTMALSGSEMRLV